MEFIELSGEQLLRIINQDELDPDDLRAVGVRGDSVVRVNRQGDIELRVESGWEVIGGLLGDFTQRIKRESGFDFA
jgi:hypothetical protein